MLDSRMLVLDDDPEIVDAIVRSLRTTVRTVDGAIDGPQALELFATHRHSIVVLDLMMPQMSGFEVMRRIHQIAPRTHVIIMTGYPSFEYAKEAVNRHAFGFLVKPFTFEELERLIVAASADVRDSHRDHEAEIAELYERVAVLSQSLEQTPEDRELQTSYRESLAELRDLQRRDAALASQVFRDHLALKHGTGYSAIEAARRVLGRDKDSP